MAWTSPITWIPGQLVTASQMNVGIRDKFNVVKVSIDDDGHIVFGPDTELTIAAGVITVTGNFHTVDTEADAASDDLATITLGGSLGNGSVLYLRPDHTDRSVVLTNAGNIVTRGGGNLTLDSTASWATLLYDSTLAKWVVIGDN